jgi:multidrug efflux pump subunit AcrA (membrane-fusion protein)
MENVMNESLKQTTVLAIAAVLIVWGMVWGIAWGITSYHKTMASGGMVQVVVPTGYTTVWAKSGEVVNLPKSQ